MSAHKSRLKLSLLFIFLGLVLLVLVWSGVAVGFSALGMNDFTVEGVLLLAGASGTLLTIGGTVLVIWQIARQGRIEQRLLQHEAELIRARGRLERSNEELKSFAHVLAHDLQEPLRSIISYAQIIKMRYQGKLDADADEFIAFLIGGAGSLKAKLVDLLDYTAIDQHGNAPEPVDLNEIVSDVTKYYAPEIEQAKAILEIAQLPTVEASRKHMLLLFEHLIANAIDFRDPQRPLSLRIFSETKKPGFCTIHVADNGIGIEPQYFSRIFALFQRLHSHKPHEGTGVGLAICKKIVEHWGGRIKLSSTPGEGTTFRFTLPLARPHEIKKA